MAIIINLTGLALILFTLYWFILSKPQAQLFKQGGERITILVKDGVYEPSRIQVPAHTPLHLSFLRQDPTPCAEMVIFVGLDRQYCLPLNQAVEINLDPLPPGELVFSCEMGMYRGRLVIE